MDNLERRIHLLEDIRRLDYQIIDKKQIEPDAVAELRQEREKLWCELSAILPKVAV
jgi:SMC interacting uncharacterized protein involved in chromosome segregation